MTDETDDDSQCRFIAAANARNDREMDQLIMSLAFAIADPAGVDELRLARALVVLARQIPVRYRMTVALETEALIANFKRLDLILLKSAKHDAQ
jgi:hypothetical protein